MHLWRLMVAMIVVATISTAVRAANIVDVASHDCYAADHYAGCDATTSVQNALAAAGNRVLFPGADGGVTTDGRSIAILTHCSGCIDTDSGLAIPEGQYFTCEGPPGARR